MNVDLPGSTTTGTLIAAKSQTNNTGGAGVDISNLIGDILVAVNIGVKTAGDNADSVCSVRLAASNDSNISNATNLSIATTNATNTASLQVLTVDRRAAGCYKYLFAIPTISGTNSPAFPLSVTYTGVKQVQ